MGPILIPGRLDFYLLFIAKPKECELNFSTTFFSKSNHNLNIELNIEPKYFARFSVVLKTLVFVIKYILLSSHY